MEDLSSLSDAELNARIAALKAELGGGTPMPQEPTPELPPRKLGFYERQGLTAQAEVGVRPSDAYDNEELGQAADFMYNAAPFTRQTARANEGAVRDALTDVAKTGKVPYNDINGIGFGGISIPKSGELGKAEKEWLDTEGRKFDLYERAEKGRDGDYSSIYARKMNPKTGRYELDVDENGNPYLDDRYAGGAEAKEAARAAHMQEFAKGWLKQTDDEKRMAQSELKNDTAAWHERFAADATQSLGFFLELYMGGMASRGIVGTGALGSNAQNIVRIAQTGGKLGWKAKTALGAMEIALPSIENAVARYEQLTADDVAFDESGNLQLTEGDGFVRGAAKAAAGAFAENAVEVALGHAVNKILGGIIKATGSTKVAQKLLGKIPSGITEKARNLWFDTTKTYAKVRNAVKMDLPAGEFAEEYVQGILDSVVGFDQKAADKDVKMSDFSRDFFNWDANLKDLTYGIIGQTLLFGGAAHAQHRYNINKLSFDHRITGALKEKGFSSWDQFLMGANKRLAAGVLANTQREYGADGTVSIDNKLMRDDSFGAGMHDVFRLCGLSEKKIASMSQDEKLAVLDAVNAVLTNKDGAEGVLRDLNRGMRNFLNALERRSMLDGNWKNVKSADERESRVKWANAVDANGNVNWVVDGENGEYVEDSATGARIYKKPMQSSNGKLSYGFVAWHPEAGYAQPAPTMTDAINWVSSMDKAVQERNDIRAKKKEYVGNFVRRLVPEGTDKKTGAKTGANVVTVNNADDAMASDAIPEQDKAILGALTDEEKGNEAFTSPKTGIVYVFADNVQSVDKMMYTLVHEIGGHIAPRAEADARAAKDKSGKTDGGTLLDTIIKAVYPNSKTKDVGRAKAELKDRSGQPNAGNIAREEGLAYGNEMAAPDASAVRRAITAVKMFIHEKFGTGLDLTDDDYNAIATAGLNKIKKTVGIVGDNATKAQDYATAPTAPMAFNTKDAAEGKSLMQAEMESRWVSDFARQQDALEAARFANGAEQDKAAADAMHADEQAKEDAKIGRMVKEQDDKEAAERDAALATPANRVGVADMLNDWNAEDPETNNLVVNKATKEEIDAVLDALEAEMGGNEGALKSALKDVVAEIKKRKRSEDAKARMQKFGNPKVKAKKERIAAENKLLNKFIEKVQQNPNSALAFWLHNGRRLFAYPGYERVVRKGKGNGFEFRFAGADNSIDALNEFFSGHHGMKKGESREKLIRLIFGENAKPGQGDGDVVMENWIRFKRRGAEVAGDEQVNGMTNGEIVADEDFGRAENLLRQFADEYAAYEEWLQSGQLTAEEQRMKDAVEQEAAMDADEDADMQAKADAKADYEAMRWKHDGNNAIMSDGTAYEIEEDGDGGYYATDKDSGETFHITNTDEYEEALNEEDTESDTDAAPAPDKDDNGRREERDAGAVGRKDGADGGTAEAPSADTENFALKAATPKEIAKEQERVAQQREIERRKDAPLKGGKGEIGQSLMDLGGAEGGDPFNTTAKWRRTNGISEDAYDKLGKNFGKLLEITQSNDAPQVKWRRTKDAGLFYGTMDEYIAKLRADKFADGETTKSGAQSIVKRVGDKVVKFRNGDMFHPDSLANIAKHNELFPDTPYTVVGVTDEDGRQRIILEQPYIDAVPNSGTEARRKLVAQLQERFGAENVQTHGDINENKRNLLKPQSWFRIDAGPWHIEDLKDLNLGIDKRDGNVKVWDAEIAYDAEKDAEGKTQGKWRRAITPAEDAAYLDAVKRGDMETCAKMVREAAAKAMPKTIIKDKDGLPHVCYHSTENDFTVFDPKWDEISNSHKPENARGVIYFALTRNGAVRARGDAKIMECFLDVKKAKGNGGPGVYWAYAENPDYIKKCKQDGFDAIRVRDEGHGTIAVFSPNQIKSADPVTYDDDGNVIPLSERFNPAKDDIRWRKSGIYTGSAADYDKPSLVKVGTGEGSQVYGWGLYGSTVRGVAEVYSGGRGSTPTISTIDGTEIPRDISALIRNTLDSSKNVVDAIDDLKNDVKDKNTPFRKDKIDAIKWLEKNRYNIDLSTIPHDTIYEQTFFTNREPGDESHLLSWYGEVDKNVIGNIIKKAKTYSSDNSFNHLKWYVIDSLNTLYSSNKIVTGQDVYKAISSALWNSPRLASEFLSYADIDGIKYPVDSYGKTVKDGDKAGWNYVSFRDDNITVDHKWRDGVQLFRRSYTPNPAAQKMADARIRSVTDALRDTKFGKDNAALFAAEKFERELAKQGSISPELRDLIERTQDGSVASRAKGNAAALFSPQNLSALREKLQDAQISLRELEDSLGIKKDASSYYQFDRNYGLIKKAVDDMQREIIDPLAKELHDNKISLDDFSMLLQALHGPERNRMIAERSPYVMTALSNKATKHIVQGILNGTIPLDDKAIANISNALGWIDKGGNRTKESRQFERDLQGSGATTDYWNRKIDGFQKSGLHAKAQKAVSLVRELTRRNRQLLVDTGRLSAAQAAMWEKLSPNYVPLRSDMEMDTNLWSKWLLGGGADRNNANGKRYADNEYNHAYGRGTLADNPLEFAIQQYEESLQRAYDNVARQRLADIVRHNPNLGKVFRYEPRMTPTKRARYAKAIAIIRNMVAANVATADDIAKMNRYQEAFNADTAIPMVKVLGQNGIVHEMPNIAGLEGTKDKPTSIIAFKEDGELKFIKLGGFDQADVSADPSKLDDVRARRIASAVKKQNMAQLNGFGRALRTATGLFSALRTAYSPTFIVSNLGADNTQALRNIYATFGAHAVGKFEHYALHSLKAAQAVMNGKFSNTKIQQFAKEWYENGGAIGGLATANIADLTNDIKRTMRKLNSQKKQLANVNSIRDFATWATDRYDDFERLAEKYNSIVEMSTRIAAYATARDMGMSIEDAVSYSRDITVNFNRKGTLTPWLNALYAFSNATMQDFQRSLLAFAEGDYAKGSGILAKRGAIMGVGLMLMGFLASAFGFWQDDEDEEKEGNRQWKYAKEWQKQNVMGIRIGEETYGVPIRGISRIPYYLGHQVYEMVSGRKNVVKAAADTIGLSAENAFDFMGQSSTALGSFVPSALRTPLVDIPNNLTFTGQQMYREPLPGQEKTAVRSEMGRKGTSDVAKWTARTLNSLTGGDSKERGAIDVQPEKIQAVWEWIFGSAGKDVANIVGTAVDTATGNLGNRPLHNIPYLSRFVRKVDENSADYYEARGRYEQAKKHYNGMAEIGDTDAMAQDVAESPWLSSRGNGKKWGQELKDLDGAVKKLLEIEKAASPEDYDAVHQLRLKTQYQFMRRLENAPTDDAEGVAAEREHRRTLSPILRARKREDKKERREEKKRKRLF